MKVRGRIWHKLVAIALAATIPLGPSLAPTTSRAPVDADFQELLAVNRQFGSEMGTDDAGVWPRADRASSLQRRSGRIGAISPPTAPAGGQSLSLLCLGL